MGKLGIVFRPLIFHPLKCLLEVFKQIKRWNEVDAALGKIVPPRKTEITTWLVGVDDEHTACVKNSPGLVWVTDNSTNCYGMFCYPVWVGGFEGRAFMPDRIVEVGFGSDHIHQILEMHDSLVISIEPVTSERYEAVERDWLENIDTSAPYWFRAPTLSVVIDELT